VGRDWPGRADESDRGRHAGAGFAERLGVSPATVARLTQQGELECVPVGLSRTRRQVRYQAVAVALFIRRRSKAVAS
jgi:predicted site-specific integrase-resolvase